MSELSKWELGDFDNAELLPSQDDFTEKEVAGEGMSGGRSDIWWPGMGTSTFKIIPFFDPMISRNGKIGAINTDVQWYEHEGFLDERVPCMKLRFGMPCDICILRSELYDAIFKNTKDQWKHPFLKENGLYASKFRSRVPIFMVKDSGDKGDTKYPRPEYSPGQIYVASLMKDPWNHFMKILRNPKWRGPGGAPVYHPKQSRLFEYEVVKNVSTGYRNHSLTASPAFDDIGPLADTEDGIKELLDKATELHLWANMFGWDQKTAKKHYTNVMNYREQAEHGTITEPKPDLTPRLSPELYDAIKNRVIEVRAMAVITVQSATDVAKGAAASKTDSEYSKGVKPEASTPINVQSVIPTDTVDENGDPLCKNKGAKNMDNPICQICTQSMECDA